MERKAKATRIAIAAIIVFLLIFGIAYLNVYLLPNYRAGEAIEQTEEKIVGVWESKDGIYKFEFEPGVELYSDTRFCNITIHDPITENTEEKKCFYSITYEERPGYLNYEMCLNLDVVSGYDNQPTDETYRYYLSLSDDKMILEIDGKDIDFARK